MSDIVDTLFSSIPKPCRWWAVGSLLLGGAAGLALAPQFYDFHYGQRLTERDKRISELEAQVQAKDAEVRKGWVQLAQAQGTAKGLQEKIAPLEQKAAEVDALRTSLQEHQQALQQWQAGYQQLAARVNSSLQPTATRLPERMPVDYGDMTFPFGDRSIWITVEPDETSPRSFVVKGSLFRESVQVAAGRRIPVVHKNQKYYVRIDFDEVPLLTVAAAKGDAQ